MDLTVVTTDVAEFAHVVDQVIGATADVLSTRMNQSSNLLAAAKDVADAGCFRCGRALTPECGRAR